jgi:hypothetical protein
MKGHVSCLIGFWTGFARDCGKKTVPFVGDIVLVLNKIANITRFPFHKMDAAEMGVEILAFLEHDESHAGAYIEQGLKTVGGRPTLGSDLLDRHHPFCKYGEQVEANGREDYLNRPWGHQQVSNRNPQYR